MVAFSCELSDAGTGSAFATIESETAFLLKRTAPLQSDLPFSCSVDLERRPIRNLMTVRLSVSLSLFSLDVSCVDLRAEQYRCLKSAETFLLDALERFSSDGVETVVLS